MPSRLWRAYLAVCSTLVAAYTVLSRVPPAQAWLYMAITVAEVGAFCFALRRSSQRNAMWALLTVSVVLWAAGNIAWYAPPVLAHHPLPFPSLSDLLFIPAYLLQLFGLIVLLRRAGHRDRGELIDATILALGAGLVIWIVAIEPALADTRLMGLGRAVTLSYPMFDIGLAAIAARMLVAGHRRVPSFWLLGAAIIVQLVTDLGFTTSTLLGTFRYGGWVCIGYLLVSMLMATAALHPSAGGVASVEPGERSTRRAPKMLLLGGAAAIGPVLLLFPNVRNDHDALITVVAGSVALVALTLFRLSGLMVDVETHRRTEMRLREAEIRYRTLVEQMPGVVYIAEFGEAGDWHYVSPKIQELLGYTLEEWLAHPAPWSTHVHPDDLERAMEDEDHSGRLGRPLSSTYRMVARDGRVRWIHDEATLVPDEHGLVRYWQGVMTDVTSVKETEHRLRAAAEDRRELLGRVVRAQEEERRRVANDIHDDPIQKMTVVGMRLALLRSKLPPELTPIADELDRSVSASIARLRHLMFELRPVALDREGLEPALRQYLADMQSEFHITNTIDNRMVSEPSPEVRAAAYRVAQEALVNVRKHSRGTSVHVVLEERERGVFVRIEDDGVGFAPETQSDGGHHLGLTAMRERAELAGGWCRISSVPGHGTIVEFWLQDPQQRPVGLPVVSAAG